MSSTSSASSSSTSAARPTPFPFDSYAKLVRMLIPSVCKVCFYDPNGRALWLSDPVDEPELRTSVVLLMERIDRAEPAPPPSDEGSCRVLPICDAGHVHGALALVLDRSRASAGYRRSGAVERLLAPLVATLAHAWSLAAPAAPRQFHPEVASRRAAIIGPAARIAGMDASTGLRSIPDQATSAERSDGRAARAAPPEAATLLPLPARIRAALRSEGFELHAQNLQRIHGTSAVPRYEILIRMREGMTLHVPGTFFDAAASHGLLLEIDRWVISRLLQRLQQEDRECEFNVNVSAASLQRKTFGDFIETQLQRSGVLPQRLLFEFAESVVLEHPDAFASLAQRLHALGCRIALDNCRQGLEVFRLVQRHPIGCLKIDGTITCHVDSDAQSLRIVRDIAEVASDIGVETVAVGVEDENKLHRLRELPIDFAQGFYFASPLPLADVMLRES